MPCSVQPDDMFPVENRTRGIHIQGELSLCEDEIQLRHVCQIIAQSQQMFCQRRGEICKDLFDLFFLLRLQFPGCVAQFHDLRRLNKECGTGGRSVVHNSLHVALVLGFYRNAIAIITDCDDIVLQIGGEAAVYHFCQLRMDPALCQLLLTAD